MVSDAAARAVDREVGVLWATCWDGAGAPAYWPWVQLVRSHLQGCDPTTLRAQLGAGAAEVAGFVDVLGIARDGAPALGTPTGTRNVPGSGSSMR